MLSYMDPFTAFARDCCRRRLGIGTLDLARAAGVAPSTFRRRMRSEEWEQLTVQAWRSPMIAASPVSAWFAVALSIRSSAVAGAAALHLHGLLRDPPRHAEVAVVHTHRRPARLPGGVDLRRRRWLTDDDVVMHGDVPVLRPAAAMITMGESDPRQVRADFLDAEAASPGVLQSVLERIVRVGPVPGRAGIINLAALLMDHSFESVFDADVRNELRRLGYRPSDGPVRITTPDGRGASPDVVLPWRVMLELQGDRDHSERAARRADRRKFGQYAGIVDQVVPIDWTEWYGNRPHVLQAIDAAIEVQVGLGLADRSTLPPHLRTRVRS